MSYTCKLETGEYDIASTVDEKLLGVFPGPPRPVDPILVGTRPVKVGLFCHRQTWIGLKSTTHYK